MCPSGKALRLFDELKDEREVAVCHFYMAPWLLLFLFFEVL